MADLRISNIVSGDDPRLEQVRLIYDADFPEDSDEGWAWVMDRVAKVSNAPGAEPTAYHILVAEGDGEVLGFMALAYWSAPGGIPEGLGFGDYLGIAPQHQGRGTGGMLYQAALAELGKDAEGAGGRLAGMAFDVEDPDLAPTSQNCILRKRRIALYERLGARLLTEVDFWEPAAEGMPGVRYRLFYHPCSRDIEPRQLVLVLYRLIYGWDEEHHLVKLSLRTDTSI